MAKKRVVIHVEYEEDDVEGAPLSERRVQDAFDHAFPYARMETFKVTFVSRPGPAGVTASETELCG